MSESQSIITKASIKHRTFFLNEDVASKSLEDIILGIFEINRLDDEKSESVVDYERKPIKLIIDTNGGEIYRGMALVNAIETSATEVHTYVYGICASMGVILALVGQKTFAHKRATFMLHQLSSGFWGDLRSMEESLEQKVKLQNMLDSIIIENSNISKGRLLEMRDKKEDWFFTGEEALSLGVVDELITRKT